MKDVIKSRFVRFGVIAAMLAILLSACGGTASAATKSKGGVVTFAEQPETPPNYISPLEGPDYYSTPNNDDFSYLMYRPLYWMGDGSNPLPNKSLSLAKMPVFSSNGTVFSITLKHWDWSDGQPITARDVIFWMNLLSAAADPDAPVIGSTSSPGPGWGDATPTGFPLNVVSYAQTGTYTVTFKMAKAYSPTWLLYNELTQISAIPQKSWDRLSASGPVGNFDVSAEARKALPGTSPTIYVPVTPGTATSGALGVAEFLNLQSQDLSTYDTNPLWKVVDGPFELSQYTTDGFIKMVPNKHYSGSPKPTISAFEEEPYTSTTAEFTALRSGALTIGYIPPEDLSQKDSLEALGYSYSPWYSYSISFAAYNFTNPTVGPILKQLYFRQAFQSLINQPEYITDFMGGAGIAGNGPAPTYPRGNSEESPLEEKGLVYPYDPSKAVSLLKANGWTVVPGGISYCSKPGTGTGQCGPGITLNEHASLSLLYGTGSTALTDEMEALQSTLKSEAGISLTLSEGSFSDVIGIAIDGCTPTAPCKGWDMVDWSDPSWGYGFLATGEALDATGASDNAGYYSSTINDVNVAATETAPTTAAFRAAIFKYDNYLARQLPLAWMPLAPQQLTMYKSTLKGLVPQGIYEELTPEAYSFKK